jgi:hypothetical protein
MVDVAVVVRSTVTGGRVSVTLTVLVTVKVCAGSVTGIITGGGYDVVNTVDTEVMVTGGGTTTEVTVCV